MLITKEVYINACIGYKYYEKLGYYIPKVKNKWYEYTVPKGTKIKVKVEDLKVNSKVFIDVQCDNCNKKLKVTYQNYLRYLHNGKYYCNKCASKILNSGEKSPRWNKYLTEEERKNKRSCNEYMIWEQTVKKRDNYTCIKCNCKKSGNLVSHHLNGYNWDKEHRYDLTNGVTLCDTCHKNFHYEYGYKNNTREQFEKWLGQKIEITIDNIEPVTCRPIYCIEENKIYYYGVREIMKNWNIKNSSEIYKVCNHKLKKIKGKKAYISKTLKNKHLLWLDEYEKMTEEEIKKYLIDNKSNKNRKVICITTNAEFNSIKEAAEFYNIKSLGNITLCCKKIYKNCGKLPDGTKLSWEYKD